MINSKNETSLPGLYCSGEVTGGAHGRNRLMGNSLLAILVFGRRSGKNAAEYVKGAVEKKSKPGLTIDHIVKFEKELKDARITNNALGPIILPVYAPDHVKKRQWTAAV